MDPLNSQTKCNTSSWGWAIAARLRRRLPSSVTENSICQIWKDYSRLRRASCGEEATGRIAGIATRPAYMNFQLPSGDLHSFMTKVFAAVSEALNLKP